MKDRDPNRKYTQLYQSYRAVPGELTKLLPHRARCDVEQIAHRIVLLLWTDVVVVIEELLIESQQGIRDVLDELRRRI